MYLCAHTFVCEIIYLINDSLDLSFYRGQELGYCCKSKTWHSVHSRLWTPSSVREWVWMPYQVDPTSAYRCRLPKPPGATERFERALSDVGLKVVWAIDDGADWWLLILTLPCIKRPSPKRDWKSVWYRGFTLKTSHSYTCCFWIDVPTVLQF